MSESRLLQWILLVIGILILVFGAFLQLLYSVTIGVTAALIILIGVVAIVAAAAIARPRE